VLGAGVWLANGLLRRWVGTIAGGAAAQTAAEKPRAGSG
jgi:hypothetical protein